MEAYGTQLGAQSIGYPIGKCNVDSQDQQWRHMAPNWAPSPLGTQLGSATWIAKISSGGIWHPIVRPVHWVPNWEVQRGELRSAMEAYGTQLGAQSIEIGRAHV